MAGTYRDMDAIGFEEVRNKDPPPVKFATVAAKSLIEISWSDPTWYGRHGLPLKRMVHSQIVKSDA